MIGGRPFVAGAGFKLAGEPWVPPRSNICSCTGYAHIVDAVVAVGGAGA